MAKARGRQWFRGAAGGNRSKGKPAALPNRAPWARVVGWSYGETGITGNSTYEARSVPWWIVWLATWKVVPRWLPVLRLRSQRGKQLLVTWMRILCPARKTLLVDQRSIS